MDGGAEFWKGYLIAAGKLEGLGFTQGFTV